MNSYEKILERMLARVPDNIDKREGSVIFCTLAPTAMFLAEGYATLEVYKECFTAVDATGEMLSKICAEYGILRRPAQAAVYKMRITNKQDAALAVDVGAALICGDLAFFVSAELGDGFYQVTAAQTGEASNSAANFELAIFQDDFGSISAVQLLEAGREEEDDESLRERYLQAINAPPFGGNPADYERIFLAHKAVGAVSLLYNPNTTVIHASVVGPDMKIVDSATIAALQEEFCPLYLNQLRVWEGLVPVGTIVRIGTPAEISISVSAIVDSNGSVSAAELAALAKANIETYFRSLIFKSNAVVLAEISAILLRLPGVSDAYSVKLNDVAGNYSVSGKGLAVPYDRIFKLEEVVLDVSS